MSKEEFWPILMVEDYWMNSQLSIARHYGGIRTKNHEYKIVNKQGITLWELSDPESKHYVKDGMAIAPGEPADLLRTDFLPFYKKLGRDAFIKVLKEHRRASDTELKEIYKEMTKKKVNGKEKQFIVRGIEWKA